MFIMVGLIILLISTLHFAGLLTLGVDRWLLKGKVVDASTGKGLADASIKFSDYETVSNWDGSYHIVVRYPYKGEVTASKSGYVTQTKYVTLQSAETTLNFELAKEPSPAPPEYSEIDLLNLLASVWNSLINWIFSMFGFLSVAEASEPYYAGDTITTTLTLTNTSDHPIPDNYHKDGTYSWAYVIYGVIDPKGTFIEKKILEKVTSLKAGESKQVSVEYTIPSNAQTGKYTIIVSLVELPATYDRATQQWVFESPNIIDKSAYSFEVVKIEPPTEPPNIIDILFNIWDTLLGWLKSVLGGI